MLSRLWTRPSGSWPKSRYLPEVESFSTTWNVGKLVYVLSSWTVCGATFHRILASPTETIPQGLTRHSFDQPTRQSFLIVLTESVKRRRRLPDSIMITEKTMAEENVHTSGGFWDVRRGTLNNSAIAIKTPRITTTTDVEKIREVSWKFPFSLSTLLRYSV